MVGIVLMINLEHSKSLRLGGSGVVTALCRLDGFAGLCRTARGRFGISAFGVRGGRGECGGREAESQGDGEEIGGDLHVLICSIVESSKG